MLLFVKAFMTFWLGMCLAFAILPAIVTHGAVWWFSLGSLGMFGAGVGFVALCKWFARKDAAWLSEVIRSALTKPTAARQSSVIAKSLPVGTPARPTVLIATAACLLLLGLAGSLGAATGISSYQAVPNHTTITHFSSWPSRAAAGVYGIVTIFLAVGIYRQEKWAWRFGLAYLGAAWLDNSYEMFSFSQVPVALKFVFLLLSLAVAVYWGLWWYAQRVHFPDSDVSSIDL